MELFVRVLPDEEKEWFPAECERCGWIGSSELLDGGGAIADAGDYDDSYCPCCGSRDIFETENEQSVISWVDRLKKATHIVKLLTDKIDSCDCSKHIYGHLEEENKRMAAEIEKLKSK